MVDHKSQYLLAVNDQINEANEQTMSVIE